MRFTVTFKAKTILAPPVAGVYTEQFWPISRRLGVAEEITKRLGRVGSIYSKVTGEY